MKLSVVLFHNKLLKSFGIYTIAKVINSCIPFFLLPVMTKYLSPSDYGIISMITTIAAFTLPFVCINTDTAVVRKYYDKKENISEYIGTCVALVLISCSFYTGLFSISSGFLSKIAKVPTYILYFIPIYCVFNFFKTIVLYSWQVKDEPIKYGLFSISFTCIEIGIALFGIIIIGLNWEGRAISLFSAAFLATSFAIVNLRKRNMFKLCLRKEKAIHALKFGTGLIPHAVGASLMVLANRFFITNMVNIEETGYYGVATQLASLMSFVTLSFNNAYVPWLFERLSQKSDVQNRKIVKLTYLYFILIFFVAFAAYFVIKIIFPIFVNESFYASLKYVPFLLIGNAFQGCYFMVTNYILYSEKTYYNGIITIISGICSLVFNYFMISKYGAVGAAIAYAFTYFIYFILTWYISNIAYKMPWIKRSNYA